MSARALGPARRRACCCGDVGRRPWVSSCRGWMSADGSSEARDGRVRVTLRRPRIYDADATVYEGDAVYKKIMLTLDGSDLAETAIPHAQNLAQATGAPLVLLQVIDSVAHILAQVTPATIEPIPSGPVTAEIAEESVSAQRQAAEDH